MLSDSVDIVVMPACRNCGAHVTDQFARVFGDNEDIVHTCMGCGANSQLGAHPDAGPTSRQVGWADRV